ncbi:MAG: hypothetical protein JO006_00480 [Paucibacter sp.]|nr:hypothetical protein [Roseateles sp.]
MKISLLMVALVGAGAPAHAELELSPAERAGLVDRIGQQLEQGFHDPALVPETVAPPEACAATVAAALWAYVERES